MPSTMVHLLIAKEIGLDTNGLFFVGNLAPDCIENREQKDKIHLRGNENRWMQLKQLYSNIDKSNLFELGWFIHLFVDACWDETQIEDYKNWFEVNNKCDNWFFSYREEIGFLSYLIYHKFKLSKEIWDSIKDVKLDEITTSLLPISLVEFDKHLKRVYVNHLQSNQEQLPKFFTMDRLNAFNKMTINRYKDWMKSIEL